VMGCAALHPSYLSLDCALRASCKYLLQTGARTQAVTSGRFA
jgi:hypothetical protein